MRRMGRAGRLAAAGVLGAVLLAGCGGGQPIPAPQAKALQQLVREIRNAAAAGNGDRFHALIDQLENTVQNYEAAGKLTHSQAQDILAAASQVNSDGIPSQSPSPTPTSESPSPTPTSESPTPTPTQTTPPPVETTPPPQPTTPAPIITPPPTVGGTSAGGSPTASPSASESAGQPAL